MEEARRHAENAREYLKSTRETMANKVHNNGNPEQNDNQSNGKPEQNDTPSNCNSEQNEE